MVLIPEPPSLSRNCGNCGYWEHEDGPWGRCNHDLIEDMLNIPLEQQGSLTVSEYFYCKLWEPRASEAEDESAAADS